MIRISRFLGLSFLGLSALWCRNPAFADVVPDSLRMSDLSKGAIIHLSQSIEIPEKQYAVAVLIQSGKAFPSTGTGHDMEDLAKQGFEEGSPYCELDKVMDETAAPLTSSALSQHTKIILEKAPEMYAQGSGSIVVFEPTTLFIPFERGSRFSAAFCSGNNPFFGKRPDGLSLTVKDIRKIFGWKIWIDDPSYKNPN